LIFSPVAVIDKETVVREEVAVSKKPVEEVRDLSGEVRREDLIVDDQTRKAS
jgi:stress response protein YsnF